MTKTQHTPGPWSATETRDQMSRVCGNGLHICTVAVRDDEDNANARLIAAAPELLDMLRKMVRAIDRMEASPVDGLADDARELIRKAEGE